MKFRPADDPRNTVSDIADVTVDSSEPGTPVEWEDNWLSNSFAWGSYFFAPDWCQTPEHWTSRLTQYLFTDCPCCLMFRGIAVGYVAGAFLGTATTFMICWFVF